MAHSRVAVSLPTEGAESLIVLDDALSFQWLLQAFVARGYENLRDYFFYLNVGTTRIP